MQTALRPLTLGEILDRTAQLYRSNFLLFAGISSIYAGVLLFLSLIQIGVEEFFRMRHMMPQVIWVGLGGSLAIVPIVIIAGGLAVAANNRAVAWVHLGQPATIRGAYSSIFPRLGRYIWLMTITAFMVWVPFVLLYAGFAFFVVLYLKPKGLLSPNPTLHNDPATLLIFLAVAAVFGLLILAAFIYAIIMGLRYSLAVPACVVEELPARKAIRRSIDLSKGARGRIFLLGLLVIAVDLGLGLITQMFFIVATFKDHGQLPGSIRALQQIVAFFTNSFVGPIYATGFTLFYYDQRVRKEGYDIERMMQAAGLSAPPAELPPPIAQTPPLPAAVDPAQPPPAESPHE
jgi:uncharacterized membrane protein